MFGIEALLTSILGDDPLLLMLAGFVLLILMNLVVKLIIEYKNDNLNWDDLPEFIKPLMLYGAFLVGLELLTMTGKAMPTVYELFQGLQLLGYVTIMGKYFKRFYSNLKALGMQTDKKLDDAFEDKFDKIGKDSQKEIKDIVEEYFRQKETK